MAIVILMEHCGLTSSLVAGQSDKANISEFGTLDETGSFKKKGVLRTDRSEEGYTARRQSTG